VGFVVGRVTGVVDGCDLRLLLKCDIEFWWSANACLAFLGAKIFGELRDEFLRFDQYRNYRYYAVDLMIEPQLVLLPQISDEHTFKMLVEQN
jgi:hypothetical protein